jgi:hypothetical protein
MMGFDGTGKRLHKLDAENPREDVSAQHPEITATLFEYMGAMRDTIQYMRENNKPDDILPNN